MTDICEQIETDPRVVRRGPGVPDPDGRCVVYWMQRAQRAVDNPALDTAMDVGNALGQPVVVFRLAPHHRVEAFAEDVHACVVIGDENPLRVPFWTVDADVIVPSVLLEKEQYAARTIRPRIHRLLPQFLTPSPVTKAVVAWRTPTSGRAPTS